MAGRDKHDEGSSGPNRTISRNRKAFHDYTITDTLEAGIALHGSEIKSLRAGHVNLRDSYVAIRDNEAWLVGTHISGYDQASYLDHDPMRDRKLLLHRKEILRLRTQVEQRGLTVVPTRLYLKNNRAKVEIGVAKGKHNYDKRTTLRDRDSEREIERELKERRFVETERR
jgi:SsrA-binding protein